MSYIMLDFTCAQDCRLHSTGLCRGYKGIMEKNMEATTVTGFSLGFRVHIDKVPFVKN